ncbi:MAG: M1 family aminopeptidase [Candidatus Thiodiazotropha sp.]|jgi:aminopeptidase N
MTRKSPLHFILYGLITLVNTASGATLIQHDLKVELDPKKRSLHVIDHIELTDQSKQIFLLHDGLQPRSLTPGVDIERQGPVEGPVPTIAYRLSMPEAQHRFTLEYGGVINHQLTNQLESPGLSRESLPGTISPEGVYLDANVTWYPRFPDTFQAFSMNTILPIGWLAISQGEGPKIKTSDNMTSISWHEQSPQDDIYLIAGPYQIYQQSAGDTQAQVFLHQRDSALAERYLNATKQYLSLYQQLIGDYPYAKFALVENFWESGYGMPSFTLLGPRVLRLPFILHTSYPHEILHNWWGNSVYVDYQSGNWSEGLTSYLADHLLDEQRGLGANHRRNLLQHYGDFVRQGNDFPLNQFRSRHSSASQAVGYGKSLMLFHMLRRQLGDTTFIAGLQRFYQNNRFKIAGYNDLRRAFEKVSQRSLEAFFTPWTERMGAPALAIEDIKTEKRSGGYRIQGVLRQTQPEPPFPIKVPLLIHQQGHAPQQIDIAMQKRETPFTIKLDHKPLQLDADPWFDLFRQLYPEETPPTLSNLFGSERLLILLPAKASQPMRQAYRDLANRWSEGYADAEIAMDSDIKQLPNDRPVWLLGRENLHQTSFLVGLKRYPIKQQTDGWRINQTSYPFKGHSFVVTQRDPKHGQSQAWLSSESPEGIAGLARKVPHYGKYSYLVFSGMSSKNRLKGQWPVTSSPLRIPLAPQTKLLQAPPPAPLTALLDNQMDLTQDKNN